MILLVNTRLLGEPRQTGYYRGVLPPGHKYEILKYTLASYAAIDTWSDIRIHLTLDPPYDQYTQDFEEFIDKEFEGYAKISYDRIDTQAKWHSLTEELKNGEDPVIWVACNHDHPFIDYNLDIVHASEDILANDPVPSSVYYSHWVEIPRGMGLRGPVYLRKDGFLRGLFDHMDTIQILHKNLFYSWWHQKDFTNGNSNRYLPRSDWEEVYKHEPYRTYVPPRELCRHFDSYPHLFSVADCPGLTIPEGFFENDIKIRYGYPNRLEGWVNVNPYAQNYRSASIDGVEWKCLLEDLPYFWKGRISEVDQNPNFDSEASVEIRNLNYDRYINAPGNHKDLGGFVPDPNWMRFNHR
jgi:hypothetical protein